MVIRAHPGPAHAPVDRDSGSSISDAAQLHGGLRIWACPDVSDSPGVVEGLGHWDIPGGAAAVDHVSPSRRWVAYHPPGARGRPGPGTKAPCAAARGSELAASVSVLALGVVLLRGSRDKDRIAICEWVCVAVVSRAVFSFLDSPTSTHRWGPDWRAMEKGTAMDTAAVFDLIWLLR
jgi:hypothetical protein